MTKRDIEHAHSFSEFECGKEVLANHLPVWSERRGKRSALVELRDHGIDGGRKGFRGWLGRIRKIWQRLLWRDACGLETLPLLA
jgi:hypothetical protein